MRIQRWQMLVQGHRASTWQDGILDSIMCFTSSVHVTAVNDRVVQREYLPPDPGPASGTQVNTQKQYLSLNLR